MQRFISLEIIDIIFTRHANFKVPPMAQILYIRALMYYFKNAEISTKSICAFSIKKNSIKNFKKFEIYFQSLQICGLVEIDAENVNFIDFWSDKIDFKLVATTLVQDTTQTYFDDLKNDEKIKNHCCKMYHLSEKTYFEHLALFESDQILHNKKYSNKGDCFSHWTSWLRLRINNLPNERVVSTAQRLG